MGDFTNPNETNNGQQPMNPDQSQYQQPQYQQPQYEQPQQPQYEQPQQQPQYSGQTQYQQPQYGGQTQYQQQPQYGGQPQYQQPKKKNGMAIASLICGIAGFVINCCTMWYISAPAAIAGIVLGILAIKKPDIEKNEKTMAIVGIVLSGVALLVALLLLIGCAALIGDDSFMSGFNKGYYGY